MKRLLMVFLSLLSFGVAQTAQPAPEFQPSGEWFNSPPLSIEDLRGKVVLVEMWTFECYNCYRSIPTLQNFYSAYKDEGFEIVGVHAPEFDREKVAANVAASIKERGVTWPVFQDNDFATWRAYGTRVWPTFFLVDKDGLIRYGHRGELSDAYPAGIAPLAAQIEQLLGE